jgi:ubiquinone/menaquinone biosynthesis C-methylase UbiE
MPELDVRRLFDRVAHLYDAGWLQRALYVGLQDLALAQLRTLRPASVVDVGCGTGIFADRLERELVPAAVAGCDLSAGMLARAAARSRRVGWVGADSARLPLRSGAVDAVVSTQAFHFFDQPAAWREFRRVLGPGGHALVGMINPKTEAASRRIARLSSAASWPTREAMGRLATDAGFEVLAQLEVAWHMRRITPLVLTVGRAPSA